MVNLTDAGLENAIAECVLQTRSPDPVNAFRGRSGFASRSKSVVIVMPADAEGYRMLAARCAEIAATAKTPQLKGMVPGSVHAVAETSNQAGFAKSHRDR